MSSSLKEVMEVLQLLPGLGVIEKENSINGKCCKIKYDELGTMSEIFTKEELMYLPASKNMQEAIENGYKENSQIIEYCNKLVKEKVDEAKETGKNVTTDTIGMFPCQSPYEDCSWDMVYEMVTPEGKYFNIRRHCY